MKIAMILEAWKPIWGGGQVVAYEIGKRLSQNYGIYIDLFVMNLIGGKDIYIEKVNENFRIIFVGKEKNWCFKDRAIWIFEVMKEILKYHKRTKYDLIYAHSNLPGIPGKILSSLLNIPIVYHVHGSGIEAIEKMYNKGFKSKCLYIIETFLQRFIKYDLEISVDRRFLKYKNINKPVYIPNGVDFKRFDKVNIKKSDFFKILFVGRLHPQKGLKYLIKAINLIKNDIVKDTKIVIIGDGEDKNKLIQKINYLKLEKFFIFKGKMFGDDLVKEYKSSHLFILPSLYEGFPLTILEAWASKLPILATSVGELPYIVKENYNGWLVEPGNSYKLAKKLKYILELPPKRLDQIGKNGYNVIKKEYCWDNILVKLFNIIDDISK